MLSVHFINYWAVIVAAVVNMVVGSIWYSKMMFAEPWVKMMGKKMDEMMGKGAGFAYAVTTVAALIGAFVLANFARDMHLVTAMKGAELGFVAWLGFVAATSVTTSMFAGQRKKLWAINAGYFLVVLIINGAILAAWHH
ncbi:MAG TPA: DUF1761 domain-containing protein [Candidatus Saccharimonadales bacterium]|nr:DUF1761 domain-containing protein [Candidatus Saccharimonadales bacterium]